MMAARESLNKGHEIVPLLEEIRFGDVGKGVRDGEQLQVQQLRNPLDGFVHPWRARFAKGQRQETLIEIKQPLSCRVAEHLLCHANHGRRHQAYSIGGALRRSASGVFAANKALTFTIGRCSSGAAQIRNLRTPSTAS